jgi:hypothetical protein
LIGARVETGRFQAVGHTTGFKLCSPTRLLLNVGAPWL